MIYQFLLFLLLIVAFVHAEDPNCQVIAPRLLLGPKYYDPLSKDIALIIFETTDYCDEAQLVDMGDNPF